MKTRHWGVIAGMTGGMFLGVLPGAFVVAPVHASAPAHVVQTGEGLLKMCQGADKVKALSMMCHSYLNGYLDTTLTLNKPGRFCLGPGGKERLPTLAVTWLKAHPEAMKMPAPEALGKVMAEHYPCR